MKKITFQILLLFFFTVTTQVLAQSVSGIVSDEFEPISSVTILQKGTSKFTQTAEDGTYQIDAKKGDTLIFMLAGFKTEERVVRDSMEINVDLKINNQLQEILVTGQGSGISKKRISTKVDVLYANQIDRLPNKQIDQILQSNTPSAQIRMSSGQSGTASIIRTRGPISVNTSTNPVIIVDGIRVDNLNSNPGLGIFIGDGQASTLADISTASIAKIEYIKGGAATTLYGADAANGVIQIITKKGNSDGEASIYVEARTGIIQGTEDFLRYDRTADAIFRTGISEEYNFGMSGGNQNFTYNIGGGILADNGYTRLNSQAKKSFSAGFTAKINEKLHYQGSASYVNFKNKLDYSGGNLFSSYANLESGSFGDIAALSSNDWELLKQNVRNTINLIDIQRKSDRFTISNKFEYDVIDDLKANFTIGLDYRNSEDQIIENNALQQSLGLFPVGALMDRALRTSKNLTTDINLTHKHPHKDFTFISMLGGQLFRSSDRQNILKGSGGVDGTSSIASFAEVDGIDLVLENANYGLYFLENIGYQKIAFLELGGRFDKNTAAGDDANAIFLPKVGVSYNFLEHDFYDKYEIKKVLISGKLRLNYGESTNFATPFSQDNTIDVSRFLGNTAIAFGNVGNDDLTSERVKTTEFGLDLNFLKDKIKFSATRYRAITSNALFSPTTLPSSGQLDQVRNVGEIENKGWELAINGKILDSKEHKLTAGFSYNYNQNEVLDMDGVAPFSLGGYETLDTRIEEGKSLGFIRGNISIKDEFGFYNVIPGQDLGDTFAPHFGSFNINYHYKKFSFFLTGDYQFGGNIVDLNALLDQSINFNNPDIPIDLAFSQEAINYADYFVFDNDFVKIRNIGASYSFGEVLKNIKDTSVSFHVSNPINITSSGLDPEVTGGGIQSQNGFASGGFNFGTQSAPRVYSMAVRFHF